MQQQRANGDTWNEMTLTLKAYAEANNYELAVVYGIIPFDTHRDTTKEGCGYKLNLSENAFALKTRCNFIMLILPTSIKIV